MEKIDMRKLDKNEMYLLRKQVVRLKKLGYTRGQIEEMTGVLANRVSQIWTAYQKGGMAALRPKTRGRKRGTQTLLSAEEEEKIRQTIVDKTPDQFRMRFMLWTREAISGLAWTLFKVKLSLRCVTNYMKRWGFTCQRPTKKAFLADDVKTDRFMKEEYPAIAARAKTEDAEIYWGDETGIDNREHYQRGFAPKGQPPVLRVESKKERINMLSAITNKGKIRFMAFEGSMCQKKLIEFMRRMIQDVKKKVFFLLDNLRVHHGKLVKAWLDKHKDRIEVFFLPPYSPELNPDEYFNHALKLDVHLGLAPRTKADIRHKAQSFVRRLQHNTQKVKAFFHLPNLAYLQIDF